MTKTSADCHHAPRCADAESVGRIRAKTLMKLGRNNYPRDLRPSLKR